MENISVRIANSEGFKTFFYAGDLKMLYFLIILMALDIFTGLIKAIKYKRLWSRKGLFGYSRKMLIFCIIILANIIDQILNLHGVVVSATLIFYIGNEALSFIENCAQIGVPIPKMITEKLAIIKKEEDNISFKQEVKEEMTIKHNKELSNKGK